MLLAGLAVELALLVGLTWPLRIGRNPHPIIDWEPLATMIGISSGGFARFAAVLVIWVVAYAVALALSVRAQATARRALILFPLLFALTLLPTLPAASKDMYHYIMEGRALVVHGANPLTTPPAALPDDPLGWVISSWEWEPSRYGPLWAVIAASPPLLAGDRLIGTVLVFKAITLAAFGATVWLVYLTVRRTRPDMALTAYVLLAWNPLLLFEAAANGHNDLLMLAFTALALYLAARRKWLLAFPALAAAVLIKYVTGLLGPLLLLWAWRSSKSGRERWTVVAGLALAACLTVVAYAPFWAGMETFQAVRGAAGGALNSPGWLMREALQRVGASEQIARVLVSVVLAAVFLVVYASALRMAWRAADLPTQPPPLKGRGAVAQFLPAPAREREAAGRGGLPDTVLRAGFLVLAVYISTVAWWFWPWYVTWLLPLAGLLAGGREARLAVVWSVAALAAYIPINYRVLFWGEVPDKRMPFFAALTVFGAAAVAAVWLYGRPQLAGAARWLRARLGAEPPAPDPDAPSATA